MKKGKVWLVGAGPSDAGLFTIKGIDVLQNADVVVYDSLVGDGILALVPPEAKLIDAGKRAGNYKRTQEETNQILLEQAKQGKNVVRLKGGDPFLFGRGGEELELLIENNIPFEIVPGVTSAVAVAAYAGIPVTHRDFCSSVHIITGHKKNADHPVIDFASLVKLNGTLVFLMGVGSLNYICENLIGAGMWPDMPAAVLEKGTTAYQRRVVSTLKNLSADAANAKITTPAVIIIGKVCALAEKFHWAEDRKLGGARVIVTRPRELASTLTKKLRAYGAEVLEIPSIETVEIAENQDLENAIHKINQYNWLAFTSPAGVKLFFKKLNDAQVDIRDLAGIKFAAIGPASAKSINERGIHVDLIPKINDADSLGAALADIVKDNEKILIPRAKIGSEELIRRLENKGILYDDIAIYDTIYIENRFDEFENTIKNNELDYVAFTSASCVRGFVRSFGDIDYSGLTAVCIGRQTAAEAEKYHFQTEISDGVSMDSMIGKIISLHQAKQSI